MGPYCCRGDLCELTRTVRREPDKNTLTIIDKCEKSWMVCGPKTRVCWCARIGPVPNTERKFEGGSNLGMKKTIETNDKNNRL